MKSCHLIQRRDDLETGRLQVFSFLTRSTGFYMIPRHLWARTLFQGEVEGQSVRKTEKRSKVRRPPSNLPLEEQGDEKEIAPENMETVRPEA